MQYLSLPTLTILPFLIPGLAFNFMASLTRDGGSVPVVIPFKRGQGNPKAAVAKLVEAKAAKANPLDAVYVSTNNLTYFGGAYRCFTVAVFGNQCASWTLLIGLCAAASCHCTACGVTRSYPVTPHFMPASTGH